MSQNILVAFFQGTGRDINSHTLDDMLEWSNSLLERKHDYIQTLFPLPEASLFNSTASNLINGDVFRAFRASPDLQNNLRRAFRRMLSFYGFAEQDIDGVGYHVSK